MIRSMLIVFVAHALAACGADTASKDPQENLDLDESDQPAITWSAELPNPYVLPETAGDEFGGISLLWGLSYTLTLPTPNEPAAELFLEICSTRATDPETYCDYAELDATQTKGTYRWGVDPSQYDVGFNVFEHTLTLARDEEELASATLRFEITATFGLPEEVSVE